ncbi:MFS transporter [Candidatus Methanarcanum hacksteinii]|uniref:MFS transporter n=1 Tax=Candidatus Methanarcanum hacksteinii TaxID=2911857 RepID=UPI0037DCE616
MSPKNWLPLIGITISVFIFNMSEFMPIGLLTDISMDLGITESKAGMIISIYAWAVAILSLPIMLLLRKMEYRRMLLMCIALFAGFQILSGISDSYEMLIMARLGVAVSHSIFWSIATPLAVRVVTMEYRRLAISMVATGTSIAMIAGLPIGRMIGLAMGWRASFISIAIVAIFALILLVIVFPRVENPGTFTLRRLPELFRNKALVGIYVVIAIFVTGYYTGYSYIEPFMIQIANLSESMTTVGLTIFGFAGIVGSFVFIKYYDRIRYEFLIGSILGVSVCLMLLNVSAYSAITMMMICMFWGFFATAFNVSFQSEAIRTSPMDASAISMSMYSGIFNVGIAMGSIIGGITTDTISIGSIGYVGGAFTMIALTFTCTYLVKQMKSTDSIT